MDTQRKSIILEKMFKQEHSLEKRKAVAKKLAEKYDDRVPVIVEKDPRCNPTTTPSLDKKKYLVPRDITLGKFVCELRKNMKVLPQQAIFLYVNRGTDILPPTGARMENLYNNYKDVDGFIYFTYTGENTFGF